MKRTPLRRVTSPRSSSQLARTPLRPRSAKTAARYRNERIPLVKRLLLAFPTCQRCDAAPSTDIHEPLLRSRGGDPYDPEQCVALCRPCHTWIHDNPSAATAEGWMRSRAA